MKNIIVEKISSDMESQEEARKNSREQMTKYLSEDLTKELEDACKSDGWDRGHKIVGMFLYDAMRLSPDAQQVHQICSNAHMYHPEIYSGQTIFFKLKQHVSGKWAAIPMLPRMNSLCWNNKIYYGTGDDWMTVLPDAIASWCGVEPSENIRRSFTPIGH